MLKITFRFGAVLLGLVVGANCIAATSFKIATVSPDGSVWTNALRSAGEQLKDATEGRVTLKIYPGGVMGDDPAVIRKMRARQLHGAIFQSGSFGKSIPELGAYNLPLKFRSLHEVTEVRAEMDEALIDVMREAGFESFGFVTLGFAHAMSNKRASSIDQARDLKVWTPKGDIAAARYLESFGISPIPLTIVDVLTGLQTGLVDTVVAPPVSVIALQWHTQIDYLLDIPFMYIFSIVAVDKARFDRLEEGDKKVFTTTMKTAIQEMEKINVRDHRSTKEALAHLGVTIVSPSDAELAEWRTQAKAASQGWVRENSRAGDFYHSMEAALKRVRTASVEP